jgi:aspartate kinase
VFKHKGEAVLTSLGIPFEVKHNCAKLSLVGAGMRGTPGVMAQIMACLHEAGVTILHSTDSNITISLLIAEEEVPLAVQALHQHFLSPATR